MRRSLQILFLLFYLGSSYVASQDRTTWIVKRVTRTYSKAGAAEIGEGHQQVFDHYPRYRQAKPKAGCDLHFVHHESLHLVLHITERGFQPLTVSHKSIRTLETILLRAPPSRL